MKKTILIIGAVAVVAVIVALWIWTKVNSVYLGTEQWLYVDRDMTRTELNERLKADFGGWGATVAKVYGKFAETAEAMPVGAYLVEPGVKAKDFARRLVRRRQTPVKVKINNVRLLSDLADKIDGQLEISADEFLAGCDSVLPELGFKKTDYIAAFLPDTYEFYWTSAPAATVERLVDYRNRFWNDQRREQARAMGLTPVQVATLASIAEEETNDAEERGTVGRLYLNRVNKGMKLQADPTVKFAVGDFTLRRILSKHLTTPSPYNTYLNKGLPPGPIRMASARTMETLLNSKPNNYIYMCAKPDFSGRHNFTSDYSEHQRNAAAYRRALNARGIK